MSQITKEVVDGVTICTLKASDGMTYSWVDSPFMNELLFPEPEDPSLVSYRIVMLDFSKDGITDKDNH
jgi:hypothetical protein